jgi:1-acyl-sn-glycerol-3-phosphate acyltransferase
MRWLAERFLKLRGWQFTGEVPPHDKFVAIGVPHTSNWDFIVFLAVVSHFKLPARVIGKNSLVRWPFGGLMRRLGIIPVDRDSGQGLVEQMVIEFSRADPMVLVVAPEGTRRRAKNWKSGFYRIATAAEVPIVLAYIDWPSKRAGLGPTLGVTGDPVADMDEIRRFYAGVHGKHPERESPIRLSDETESQ